MVVYPGEVLAHLYLRGSTTSALAPLKNRATTSLSVGLVTPENETLTAWLLTKLVMFVVIFTLAAAAAPNHQGRELAMAITLRKALQLVASGSTSSLQQWTIQAAMLVSQHGGRSVSIWSRTLEHMPRCDLASASAIRLSPEAVGAAAGAALCAPAGACVVKESAACATEAEYSTARIVRVYRSAIFVDFDNLLARPQRSDEILTRSQPWAWACSPTESYFLGTTLCNTAIVIGLL